MFEFFHNVDTLRLKWIDHVVVVAPAVSLDQMEAILSPLVIRQQKRYDCIAGSSTRHRSIKAGLNFVLEHRDRLQANMIIVHDGARPFVEENVLHKLVSNAHQFGVSQCG